jgi:hypothetical protein
MQERLGSMRGLTTRATAARWRTARRLAVTVCAVGGLLGGAPAASAATGVHTVDWAPDAALDGGGTGTLLGQTVTYATIVEDGAGTSFALDWNTALGTNDAVGTGVSSQTAGVIGAGISASATVSFSSTVVNPIVYAAFGDPVTSLEFVGHPFTLLDANNATLDAFGLVNFDNAAANTADDSFAVRVHGTFGPGNPLQLVLYNYSGTSSATMAFTIGVSDAPPTVTIASPPDGARFGLLRMLLDRPRARFSCADDIAVATCSATADGRPIDDGAPLPAGLGAHTLTVTATDDAGHTHSETRSYRVGLW